MPERRVALVVATDRYDDQALLRLAAPAADAAALAEVLGNPELGGFDVDVVQNATSWEVAERVEVLLGDRRPDDLVLLHFSCHGLKDDSGELYLAATNTVPTRLSSTAVDAALVNRLIRRSRAGRVVLLLDCCYGGAFERGVVARASADVDVAGQFDPEQLGGGRGRAVITASSATEFAFEGGDLADATEVRPSVFTSALVEGIATGGADRDQDGRVSLGELYDFVFDRVRATTPHQTPSKWEFGLQGDLVIARNPRRRVRPGALPAELQALVDSPTTAGRLGAVAELAHLAEGDDLPLAAAAHAALRQLADDDSRRVSAAAGEAAARTGQVELETTVLDLGATDVAAPPLTAGVRVTGTPLALASPVTAAHPALTAALDRGVLRVTATTATAGPLAADVVVAAPAGDVVLHVTATVRDVGPGPGDEVPGRRGRFRRRPTDAGPGTGPTGATRQPTAAGRRRPAPSELVRVHPEPAPATSPDVLAMVLLALGGVGLMLLVLGEGIVREREGGGFVMRVWSYDYAATRGLPLIVLALGLVAAFRRRSAAWPVGVVAGITAMAWHQVLGGLLVQRLSAELYELTDGWYSLVLVSLLLTAGVALLVRDRPVLRGQVGIGRDSWHLAGLLLAGVPLVLAAADVAGAKDYGELRWLGGGDLAVLALLALVVCGVALAPGQARAAAAAATAFLGVWLLQDAIMSAGSDVLPYWLRSFAVDHPLGYPRPSLFLVVPAVLAGCLLATSRSWAPHLPHRWRARSAVG